jgi:hypothetical protein
MTTSEITAAVVEWARASAPMLAGGYDYVPASKTEALPDVVVEVQTSAVVPNEPRLPQAGIQQAMVKVHTVGVSVMVDNRDPQAAADQLREIMDGLSASLLGDGSLGGRIPMTSPQHTIDYTRPFVRYADGTEGREAVATIIVGEPVTIESEDPWA